MRPARTKTSPPEWLPEFPSFGESAPTERAVVPPPQRAAREPDPDPAGPREGGAGLRARARTGPAAPASPLEPLLLVSSDAPGASVFLNRRPVGAEPPEDKASTTLVVGFLRLVPISVWNIRRSWSVRFFINAASSSVSRPFGPRQARLNFAA